MKIIQWLKSLFTLEGTGRLTGKPVSNRAIKKAQEQARYLARKEKSKLRKLAAKQQRLSSNEEDSPIVSRFSKSGNSTSGAEPLTFFGWFNLSNPNNPLSPHNDVSNGHSRSEESNFMSSWLRSNQDDDFQRRQDEANSSLFNNSYDSGPSYSSSYDSSSSDSD